MSRKKKPKYSLVDINYQINSSLGSLENARFRQNIMGEVLLMDEDDNTSEKIGQIIGDKLLIEAALEAGCSSEPVFDTEELVYQIGHVIYDYRENDFTDSVREAFDHNLMSRDILVLSRMELLPEFRRANIGKHLIKDFYTNFIGGCSLMVLKCFPLQLEHGILESEDEWVKRMQYGTLEQDKEKATYTLLHFYLSMGFRYFPEISKDLLFLCPALINQKFDKIILD